MFSCTCPGRSPWALYYIAGMAKSHWIKKSLRQIGRGRLTYFVIDWRGRKSAYFIHAKKGIVGNEYSWGARDKRLEMHVMDMIIFGETTIGPFPKQRKDAIEKTKK